MMAAASFPPSAVVAVSLSERRPSGATNAPVMESRWSSPIGQCLRLGFDDRGALVHRLAARRHRHHLRLEPRRRATGHGLDRRKRQGLGGRFHRVPIDTGVPRGRRRRRRRRHGRRFHRRRSADRDRLGCRPDRMFARGRRGAGRSVAADHLVGPGRVHAVGEPTHHRRRRWEGRGGPPRVRSGGARADPVRTLPHVADRPVRGEPGRRTRSSSSVAVGSSPWSKGRASADLRSRQRSHPGRPMAPTSSSRPRRLPSRWSDSTVARSGGGRSRCRSESWRSVRTGPSPSPAPTQTRIGSWSCSTVLTGPRSPLSHPRDQRGDRSSREGSSRRMRMDPSGSGTWHPRSSWGVSRGARGRVSFSPDGSTLAVTGGGGASRRHRHAGAASHAACAAPDQGTSSATGRPRVQSRRRAPRGAGL